MYIAVIHYVGTEAGDDIVRALGRIKYAVKSKTMRGENTEMAVEVFCKDPNMEFADRIRAVKGVQDVTLINTTGSIMGKISKDPAAGLCLLGMGAAMITSTTKTRTYAADDSAFPNAQIGYAPLVDTTEAGDATSAIWNSHGGRQSRKRAFMHGRQSAKNTALPHCGSRGSIL